MDMDMEAALSNRDHVLSNRDHVLSNRDHVLSSRDLVLSNRDLVRHLLASSTGATPLLQTSKSLRELEPCAEHFEAWAENECPATPSPAQQPCLDALGGHSSAFCTGTYTVTALDADGFPTRATDVAPSRLAARVAAILAQPARPRVTTVVAISWYGTTIRVEHSSPDGATGYSLLVDRGRWRRERCRPSSEQLQECITALLTRTGHVQLPCPANPIRVPRALHVRCHRTHEQTDEEFVLFTADRG